MLPLAKCLEKHYFVPVQVYEGFYSYSTLNFLVVTVVNDRPWQGRFKSSTDRLKMPRPPRQKDVHLIVSSHEDSEPASPSG